MTLEEVIAQLPDELKEIAQHYLPLLKQQTDEEAMTWIDAIVNGCYDAAYTELVASMTVSQLATELGLINEKLKKLNKENVENLNIQKAMLKDVLTVGMRSLLAAIK